MRHQGMAFSVAMNSKRANAIVALLIASNFAEIKGVVFKRFDARRLLILSCQVQKTILTNMSVNRFSDILFYTFYHFIETLCLAIAFTTQTLTVEMYLPPRSMCSSPLSPGSRSPGTAMQLAALVLRSPRTFCANTSGCGLRTGSLTASWRREGQL